MRYGDAFLAGVTVIWCAYEAIVRFGRYGVLGVIVVGVGSLCLNAYSVLKSRTNSK